MVYEPCLILPCGRSGGGAFCAIIDEIQLPLKKTAWYKQFIVK